MKIAQAQIQMQSTHVYLHEQSKEESLTVWIGDERPISPENQAPDDIEQQVHDYRVSLSDTAMRRYMQRSQRRFYPGDQARGVISSRMWQTQCTASIVNRERCGSFLTAPYHAAAST